MQLCNKKAETSMKKFLLLWYPEFLVFVLSACFFGLLWILEIPTDIQPHAYYVRDVVRNRVPLPANFLYYLMVYFFSFAKVESWQHLCFASAVVLGFSVAAKFAITRRLLAWELDGQSSFCPLAGGCRVYLFSLLFSLALLFTFSLPMRLFYTGGYFYLGQIPPNVWHNSTTIFLMPFALLLFWCSYLQINDPSNMERVLVLSILSALNIFVKPSFIFAFVVVYPLYMFTKNLKRSTVRLFMVNMTPVFLAGVLTVLMYLLIYSFSFGTINVVHVGKSGVGIRPFLVWQRFSPNILLSVALSILFPAAYILLRPQERREVLLRYAWALYAIAVLIFIIFDETGPRAFHGNFFWQTVVCSYTLFFSTCLRLGRDLQTTGWRDWKNLLLLLCLGTHVVSGMVYLPSIVLRQTFL